MKNLLPGQKLVSFALIIGTAILLFNCERDADEFGKDFLSRKDSVPVYKDTLYNYNTFLEKEPEFPTVTNKFIIGNFENEYFGVTKASALGVYLVATAVDSGTVTKDIEAEMTIKPNETFGTFEEMDISLYEVTDTLELSKTYLSSENPEDYYSTDAPEISESISFQGDSLIKIQLSQDFTEKLNKRTFQHVEDTLAFNEAIKGILFTMDNSQGEEGGIISSPTENATMHLHYTEVGDTIRKTVDYEINSDFSVRFNMFEHNYSGTLTEKMLNEGEDSLMFIQNLQGTRGKVTFTDIPSMKDKYKEKLIANASLIFDIKEEYTNIDSTESNMRAFVYKEDSTYKRLNNYMKSNFGFQLQPYEAYIDKENNEMVFNITAYYQSLLDNKIDKETIYLHTTNRGTSFKQIVLSGNNPSSPARLEIEYYKTEKNSKK